jgi:hypothetical protein
MLFRATHGDRLSFLNFPHGGNIDYGGGTPTPPVSLFFACGRGVVRRGGPGGRSSRGLCWGRAEGRTTGRPRSEGSGRRLAVRRNGRRHARDWLLLLHIPGSMLGPAPLGQGPAPVLLGLAGWAMDVGLRSLHARVGRRRLATLAGGNHKN